MVDNSYLPSCLFSTKRAPRVISITLATSRATLIILNYCSNILRSRSANSIYSISIPPMYDSAGLLGPLLQYSPGASPSGVCLYASGKKLIGVEHSVFGVVSINSASLGNSILPSSVFELFTDSSMHLDCQVNIQHWCTSTDLFTILIFQNNPRLNITLG